MYSYSSKDLRYSKVLWHIQELNTSPVHTQKPRGTFFKLRIMFGPIASKNKEDLNSSKEHTELNILRLMKCSLLIHQGWTSASWCYQQNLTPSFPDITSVLRIFFHPTNSTKVILGHMLKKSIPFSSTAPQNMEESVLGLYLCSKG